MNDRPQSDNPTGPASSRTDERPTLKTIAFMTGLGVTTVSRALKDAPEIGVETRKRVQLVARQVGYRPNRAGVRLRTGKTNVISLVLNTEEQVGGFVSDMIYGISEHLAQTPYHFIVTPYSRTNDPLEPVRYVVETGSADGIIISRTEPNDARVRYMVEHGFPFTTHGRTHMGIEHPFHDFDNRAYAVQAVRKLKALGRKRIALLAPTPNLSYYRHMREGFLAALAECELDEISFSTANLDQSIDEIREHTRELMRRRTPPDGIVSGSGSATFALVAGTEDVGLSVGADVAIVSKQSSKLLHLLRSNIYVVNEDIRLAGRELARSVIGAIDRTAVSSLQSLSVPEAVETW
ncbi:LacI family transcriptional regulator [Mesorhizobium sp. YR577]|jgi:LacI family transcriptional regulator|uniref:LacI family transcriptional regulator n=1 Tax=Mesorhizobium sp. YR577 TaxID=1884373 RepID=UPI0008E6E8DD|nr:LacI family transcriptional regulator [Mesorhizobium sp. YR577]SFT67437.1 transcriptional regulator, LacI family [Mesorhizobium sp. YR577]